MNGQHVDARMIHVGEGAEGRTAGRLEQFAALVLDDSHLVSVIGAANQVVRRCSRAEAIESGHAFFGRVRDDVLAVDFDKETAVVAASRLYWLARMRGYPALLVASGQAGRRHVFVCAVDAEERLQLGGFGKPQGGDIRADIRPPLAPHRWRCEGVRPQILLGEAAVLAFADTGEVTTRPWGLGVLNAALDGSLKYRSRSDHIAAVALAAVNSGWSLEELEEMLAAPGIAVADAYSARASGRGTKATRKWLYEQVWSSAVRRVREHPAKRLELDSSVAQIVARMPSLSWPGRGGPGQWAVYAALVRIATEVNGPVVNASERRLCQEAGLTSRSSVQRALKGLTARALIEPARASDRPVLGEGAPLRHRWTGCWRILSPLGARRSDSARAVLEARPSLGVLAAHDAFLNGTGLGKNAHRVWALLQSSPALAPKAAAKTLELDTRTVVKHLKALEQSGLAERVDDHWLPVSRNLDVVAADIGSRGRLARLQQVHERQGHSYDAFQRQRSKEPDGEAG